MSAPNRWTDYNPYLSPDDLAGRAVTLSIDHVGAVEVYDQREKRIVTKPVLHFTGKKKYLILSPTNRKALLAAFGNDVAACIGKQIILRVEKVKAFGEEKATIRISATSPALATAAP